MQEGFPSPQLDPESDEPSADDGPIDLPHGPEEGRSVPLDEASLAHAGDLLPEERAELERLKQEVYRRPT